MVNELAVRKFFNTAIRIDQLVSRCLFRLVKSHPQLIVKLLRDLLKSSMPGVMVDVCALVQCILALFDSETDQYIVAILTPAVSKMFASEDPRMLDAVNTLKNRLIVNAMFKRQCNNSIHIKVIVASFPFSFLLILYPGMSISMQPVVL